MKYRRVWVALCGTIFIKVAGHYYPDSSSLSNIPYLDVVIGLLTKRGLGDSLEVEKMIVDEKLVNELTGLIGCNGDTIGFVKVLEPVFGKHYMQRLRTEAERRFMEGI